MRKTVEERERGKKKMREKKDWEEEGGSKILAATHYYTEDACWLESTSSIFFEKF